MASRCAPSTGLFLPFLYPSLFRKTSRIPRFAKSIAATLHTDSSSITSHSRSDEATDPSSSSAEIPLSRLNPAPDDYSLSTFADKARLTVYAGGGGHGCVAFMREAFMAEGPANGGDGGHGGSVYVQAVRGETSLHKLARRRFLRASRGRSGQGDARGGSRGDDLVIQVPVGTVVREVERADPVAEEVALYRRAREQQRAYQRRVREAEEAAVARAVEAAGGDEGEGEGEGEGRVDSEAIKAAISHPDPPEPPNLHKFILYPGLSNGEKRSLTLPRLPRRERLLAQPPAPIRLDLSVPTERPILVAAGGLGGLGNPHFVSKERPRPLFATRGERAVSVTLEFELKLLADVGLVGLPNAGKSTLLRALTRSRARVGSWAFTTLQPNIGTVVLDNHKGRPVVPPPPKSSSLPPRSRVSPFTALVNDASSSSSRSGSVVLSSPSSSSWQPEQQQHHLRYGYDTPEPRTRFTVADIPGLIEGAHLDRGLGIAFLRHVERAGVLAFAVDLGAGDAVKALKALWAEVGLYARMREEEEREREVAARIDWEGDGSGNSAVGMGMGMGMMPTSAAAVAGWGGDPFSLAGVGGNNRSTQPGLDIAAKPWLVIATKGDLPATQENYARLKEYLGAVTAGREPHPSGVEGAWTEDCAAIPVSAIHGQGVDRIIHWVVGLLDR